MTVSASIAGLYWPPREAATSAFDHYPEVLRALVPELATSSLTNEPRASCGRCPLLPEHSGAHAGQPWAFDAKVRCCTFNPTMPNFLVGSALNRGGVSEERIRTRMQDPTGVEAWGIKPPEEWVERYEANHREGFGKDLSLKCPYWVEGPFGCGIWHDRTSVCRTWFCKHDTGGAGRDWWTAAKGALAVAEIMLAEFCIEAGTPPPAGAPTEEWVAFYKWCAERVTRMSDADVARVQHPELARRRKPLEVLPTAPGEPDVAIPSPSTAEKDGDTAWICGYTGYDTLHLPRSVFLFFSLLDGKRTWREALATTNAQAPVGLSEADVHELFRIGAIKAPGPGEVPGTERDDPDMREVAPGVHVAFRVRK